jgi:hypothetical protein
MARSSLADFRPAFITDMKRVAITMTRDAHHENM